jgi:hypothetical protein
VIEKFHRGPTKRNGSQGRVGKTRSSVTEQYPLKGGRKPPLLRTSERGEGMRFHCPAKTISMGRQTHPRTGTGKSSPSHTQRSFYRRTTYKIHCPLTPNSEECPAKSSNRLSTLILSRLKSDPRLFNIISLRTASHLSWFNGHPYNPATGVNALQHQAESMRLLYNRLRSPSQAVTQETVTAALGLWIQAVSTDSGI